MYHLEYGERRSIERYRSKGKSIRWIATQLVRGKSSIATEVKQGSVKGVYRADRAQQKADLRRTQAKQKCLKVAMDPVLKAYVTERLVDNQSPEGISGRIKTVDVHIPYASPKAIYAFVRSCHGGPLQHHLYRKRVKRKSGRKRGTPSPHDHTKTSINQRSKQANDRSEFGHFEGDFIESGRAGTGSLLVLVERRTRYPFVLYTDDKTTLTINELIAGVLRDVPVKSITLDNDISFQKHEELSDMIGAVVYFTHPYTSSEKGTVENRNGRIREFVPKGCDISHLPPETIQRAQEHLRTRYMTCLDFRTPAECWEAELAEARAKMEKITRVMVTD